MGTLVCPLCCDNRFSNRLSLRQHLLGVLRNVHCSECNEKFETILELAYHLDGMCGSAVDSIKDEDMLELKDNKEDTQVVICDKKIYERCVENSENEFFEVEKIQMEEDPQPTVSGGLTAVFIKTEVDDENSVTIEDTHHEDTRSVRVKSEIDIEDSQISETEAAEQSKDRSYLLQNFRNVEEMQYNSDSWTENNFENLERIVQERVQPGPSLHRSSCSKCGVTVRNIQEHNKKFHKGLNVNINVQRSRRLWRKEDMRAAITAVRKGIIGVRQAAMCFNVPKTTLTRKVRSKEENIDELIFSKLGRRPTLTAQLETMLVSHCLEMRSRFCNLSDEDIKRMAFKLASTSCTSHPFSKNNGTAGKHWFQNFMLRHPYLKREQKSKTSDKVDNIKTFFDVFQPLMDIIEHMPSRLYNYDMTGIAVVKGKVNRISYLKDKKEIKTISKGDKCSMVSLVTCTNAVGHFLPPLLIFPGINIESGILDDGPDGPVIISHKSGWIDDEILVSWLQNFINNVKPSKEDPVILVMGHHRSYMWNMEFLELARQNGVHLICLPSQSAHKMQPLEVGFMQSFKEHFALALESWQKQNEGKIITHVYIGKLMCETFKKTTTLKAATDGFKNTGLFPYNCDVFNDCDRLEEMQDVDEKRESSEISLFDSAPSTDLHIDDDDVEDEDDDDDVN